MIKTKKATIKYLSLQNRPVLNQIIKQHNILNVSRMNIHDLRDLMYKKRVREYDPDYREPKYLLRAAQVQVSAKELKAKVAQQKDLTVKYVKKVVEKNKIIKVKDAELLGKASELEGKDKKLKITRGNYVKGVKKGIIQDKKIKEFKNVLDKMNVSDAESKKYVDELVKYNKFLKNAVTKK
tara:strand:- start:13 stop:555 length:543 start_codon:yes stop_codon:yes gene_type:complete